MHKDRKRSGEMDEMLQIADKLCADYPYIRVDLYLAKHKIYFGELTLFPASGMNPFTPSSYDDLFGSWIDLGYGHITDAAGHHSDPAKI